MRKVSRERWARIKAAAKLLIATFVLATTSAYAIPASVLRQQAHQRVDIEWDVLTCSANADNCSAKDRDKIVANIKAYIAGIQADIDWCRRLRSTSSRTSTLTLRRRSKTTSAT